MPSKPQEKPIGKHPSGKPIFGYHPVRTTDPVCFSPLRNKPGRRCMTGEPFLAENGRCELHGGATPRGPNSPHFETGKFSFYRDVLRPEHQEEFDRLMANGAYTSMQEDIATARMRLRRAMLVFEALDPRALNRLFKLGEEARVLLSDEYDEEDIESTLRGLVKAVGAVQAEISGGQLVERAQEQVRRLVETENKRLMTEQDQIPAARALALFFTLHRITTENIRAFIAWLKENHPEAHNDPSKPKLLRLIAQEIAPLLPRRQQAPGGDVIEQDDTTTALVTVD